MRSHTLLCSALLAACSSASAHNYIRRHNSSSISSSPSTPDRTITRLETSSVSFTISSLTVPSSTWDSLDTSSTPGSTATPSDRRNATVSPTDAPSSTTSRTSSNSTTLISTNSSTPAIGVCTGCVLEAYNPTRTWFASEWLSTWTSIIVTETILNKTITYMTGTEIETVVTEYETLNQTKTVVGSNTTITLSTPVFTVTPTEGVEVTLAAGPTYVIYNSIYGGPEVGEPETAMPTASYIPSIFETEMPEPTCFAVVSSLADLMPTRTEDWSYFIYTMTDSAALPYGTPLRLPPDLVEFLKQDPDVEGYFNGSDIATCTLRPTYTTTNVFESTQFTFQPSATPPALTSGPPTLGFPTQESTTTFLSTTYDTTSTHVTVRGCLRCDNTAPIAPPVTPTPGGDSRPNSQPGKPHDPPSTPKPEEPPKPNPNTPDIPGATPNPQPRPHDGDQSITIGDSVFNVHPAQPTEPNHPNTPGQPNEPNPQYTGVPGVVIGTDTLTPGQTATINGVPVVVPTAGGGSTIVVDGSTIGVKPGPTGPPVLTVGDTTVTANSQGQFIVGSQTLTPGGPAITVDGSTLSLGPSGTVAIVNGVTQTLGNAAAITDAPMLTVDGKTVSATVIGGSTMFVLGPDQTLTPGGVLTVDGTTYSMPKDGAGSTVVVNGITSTLDTPGLPVLTLGNSESITATIEGGTTAFILGPGQTLTPGGVITVDGTTISMPASASGSVVVIDGVTSTLGQGPITAAAALTINGKTYSATVRDGTTEYVLGPGTTLKPGEAITVSGTTYSLDPKGTALIINGKTSTIPKTPASNTAITTGSASKSASRSGSSSSTRSSSSTSLRDPGNFIASGFGITSKGGAVAARAGGLDKWIESAVIGLAGWILMLI